MPGEQPGRRSRDGPGTGHMRVAGSGGRNRKDSFLRKESLLRMRANYECDRPPSWFDAERFLFILDYKPHNLRHKSCIATILVHPSRSLRTIVVVLVFLLPGLRSVKQVDLLAQKIARRCCIRLVLPPPGQILLQVRGEPCKHFHGVGAAADHDCHAGVAGAPVADVVCPPSTRPVRSFPASP